MVSFMRKLWLHGVQKKVLNLPSKLRGHVSDGYHTFEELYEHRVELYIALCREYDATGKYSVWRSLRHSDESQWEGWFILGINMSAGQQVTYHLPVSKWNDCAFALTMIKAPHFDGHTSADVLQRLKTL